MKVDRSVRIVLLEAVAIVVSILLAFAIDAAWELRGQRQDQAEVLTGLLSDYQASRGQMDFVLAQHRDRAIVFEWFQAATAEEITSLSHDRATEVYRKLYVPNTFNGIRGNTDALIGAGRLDLVENLELRGHLVEFLNMDSDSAEEAATMRSASNSFLRLTAKHGGPWNPGGRRAGESRLARISAADLINLWQDPAVMSEVRLAHHWSVIYLAELSILSGVIDEILVLLERAAE